MDKTWVVNADCPEVDLDVQLLFTESCCDFLYINGVQYKGNNDPFQVCVNLILNRIPHALQIYLISFDYYDFVSLNNF